MIEKLQNDQKHILKIKFPKENKNPGARRKKKKSNKYCPDAKKKIYFCPSSKKKRLLSGRVLMNTTKTPRGTYIGGGDTSIFFEGKKWDLRHF